jgi:hypothetical protein
MAVLRRSYIYWSANIVFSSYFKIVALGSLVVRVLAIGPKIHGFKPGRERWIFKVDKNP